MKVKLLSRVRLFATPWTEAHQAFLSVGFSRQEYWSGVPSPSPLLAWRHCVFNYDTEPASIFPWKGSGEVDSVSMSVSFNNLPFLFALKSWRVNGVFISYFLRMKHSSLSSPIDYGPFCFLS